MIPLRFKWLIPMVFAALCAFFVVIALGSQLESPVLRERVKLAVGAEKTWSIDLDTEKMYTIKLVPPAVGLGQTYDISAELAKGEQTIFALDDSFWHQTGRWSEGGESGTWNEQNAKTEFNFRISEKGKHSFSVSLSQAKPAKEGSFQIQIMESTPLPFGSWPFFFGAIFFLIFALYMMGKRKTYFAKSLHKYDVGTTFKIAGVEYLVEEVHDYFYMHQHWATEFKLRGSDGTVRYLSSDRFELEGEESSATYHQVLMDLPLDSAQKAELEGQTGMRDISFNGEHFTFDDDNSGMSTQILVKNGTPYRNRIDTNLFHSSMAFPTRPGALWIDYSSVNQDESEWTVSVIMKWTSIKIVKSVKRQKPPFSPNDVTELDANPSSHTYS